jgi:hypothetical protein
MVKYCTDCNLKCHMKETKILSFKKGGKLKKKERWCMCNQAVEVVDEVSYLGITQNVQEVGISI